MKIHMIQMNVIAGDVRGNKEKLMAEYLAVADKCDLVVSQEMVLAGYFPWDIMNRDDFLDENERVLEEVVAATKGKRAALLVGIIERNNGVGYPLFNGAVMIKDGLEMGRVRKELLPTYDVFDERRYFEPGSKSQNRVFEIFGTNVGVLICEELWNEKGQTYAENPVEKAVMAGADLIVSINASPNDIGKSARREKMFSEMCVDREVGLVYVNQIGGQDEIIFDGSSFAMSSKGVVNARLKSFEEDSMTVVWNGSVFEPSRIEPRLPKVEEKRRQLILALRDYTRKNGFSKVLVGSSGGIDSALTIALAVEALGAENVEAVTMPSIWSSEGSVDDSVELCQNYGVSLLTYPINVLCAEMESQYEKSFGETASPLGKENIQPRIRGTVLMTRSNSTGALVLSTGNKSEMSVGYATLYGDMCGGFNLLGDLFKMEVYELSRWIVESSTSPTIPLNIIEKEPSAELSENQKDSDALPPYPILDAILKLYIEGPALSESEAEEARDLLNGVSEDIIKSILSKVEVAEYKRRQAAPTARVRGKAYGVGRRMPLSRSTYWRTLK